MTTASLLSISFPRQQPLIGDLTESFPLGTEPALKMSAAVARNPLQQTVRGKPV